MVKNGKTMKTHTIYPISGMTCNNCVARVQAALTPYADEVEVTLKPPQVKLAGQKENVETLNEMLKNVGNYAIGAEVLPEKPTENSAENNEAEKSFFATYKPLLLVFFYILLVTLAIEFAHGDFEMHRFMPNFMAGFFLVFSFFKLLDLSGFAQSYRMYDVLAKKIPAYGYIYPFIELGLGAAYLLGYRPADVNLATLIVMTFSSIGVILAVANKQKIRCACLGTGFNLPMTTVTIVEDLLMVAMSAYMLIWHLN
jgi:copper chaperone CopZ